MRTCIHCGAEKPASQFNRKGKYYDSLCKGCRSDYFKAYYRRKRAEVLEKNERWRAENRTRVIELSYRSTAKRRARRAGAESDLPHDYRPLLLDFYGRRCAACGATERLTHDHVVPLSRGGGHTWRNSQVLCLSCNARKQDVRSTDHRDWSAGVLYAFEEGLPVIVYDTPRQVVDAAAPDAEEWWAAGLHWTSSGAVPVGAPAV